MLQIKPFEMNHVKDAANVFIANYQLLRQNFKELPEKYEKPDTIIALLTELVQKNPAAIAMSDNQVVGYMTGYSRIPALMGNAAGVFMPEWAHSVMSDANKAEVYHQLYCYLAKIWVSDKCYNHCMTYFADDSIVQELFFKLSFGMLVIDGLRSLERIEIKPIKGVQIREADEGDLPGLLEVSKQLIDHLNQPPIFLNRVFAEMSTEEQKAHYLGPDVKTFVAVKDNKIVSALRAALHQGNGCDIVRDYGTLGVNLAFTDPAVRGLGVASNVLGELINWGIANNMQRCSVDCESLNREATSFWLRHFKPVCYSLIRKVDDRA